MFYYSRNRRGEHPQSHLAGYAGILQADAYDGYGKLYQADRKPGPIQEAACWVHARRPFFIMADIEENARRKAAGKKEIPLSPIAIEVVRRIDALFEIERVCARGRSARRSPSSHSSWGMLHHALACRSHTGIGGRSSPGQIVVSLAVTRPSAPRGPGCARRLRKISNATAGSPQSGSGRGGLRRSPHWVGRAPDGGSVRIFV
jgi:hypothetical protein